ACGSGDRRSELRSAGKGKYGACRRDRRACAKMSDSSTVCATGGPGRVPAIGLVVREMGAVGQLSVDHAEPHPVDGAQAVLAAPDGRRLLPGPTYHALT